MKRLLRQRLHHVVIVTLKSETAFRGVLWQTDSEAVVLRNCEVLDASATDRNPIPVDGELVILRPDIAYLQLV